MTPKLYFTPGPSQVYFTVEEHVKNALKTQVASISHRSQDFQKIFQEATENLRQLLSLPDDYHVLFTASATEIWERAIQNCVEYESFHFVNGAFSKRFFQIAKNLDKLPLSAEAPEGSCVDIDKLLIPENAELIAMTHNETSTGAAQPLDDIYKVRKAFPNQLIALDVVSSLPYIDLDYDQIDMAYFSVQKCFGLPAGLGVWLVNQKCVEKSQKILDHGKSIGSYHSLPSLIQKARQNQTPETPNVFGIYLLAKVAGDMLTKGLKQIRQETDYKSAVIYNMLEQHADLSPFVKKSMYRSKTTIVGESPNGIQPYIDALDKKGMVAGKGYGQFKEMHIRIANFPTHSKEQIEMLADTLENISA